MSEITIPVKGMKCGGCQKNVENAVKSLPGASNVVVDLKAATVKMTLDESKTTTEQVRQKIREAGYKPE